MSAAAELREALARIDGLYPTPEQFQVIEDAARTVALPILEADPELLGRITVLLWGTFGDVVPLSDDETAKKILAAILDDYHAYQRANEAPTVYSSTDPEIDRLELWEFRCKISDITHLRIAKSSKDSFPASWFDEPRCLPDRDNHPDCGWVQVL